MSDKRQCIVCKKIKLLNNKNFYYNRISKRYYSKCKSCCLEYSKKRNSKNIRNWIKGVRPRKTKQELQKIKDNLNKQDYLNSAIDRMADIIIKGLED